MGPHLSPAVGRLPGWEARLAAAVESARGRPYALGEHDCFRFACSVVQALTGVDLWPVWAGRYRTRRQALRRIREFGGAGFSEAATRLFGAAPVATGRARRGDVLEYRDAAGEQHLGICTGADVAVLLPEQLGFVRPSECRHAWRIG